ncbi:hypothetical protein E3I18_00890 [Candidatus Woesebacteria bacterium]|nr:MAG: hypothetical protein E3I18_00890 [Candidatus Woesebacteria bacterium]
MNRERENPTLRALKYLWGPNAGIEDLPPNKPIEAGNIEAIREAGIESRKIAALAKTYKEPKIKGCFKRILIKYS